MFISVCRYEELCCVRRQCPFLGALFRIALRIETVVFSEDGVLLTLN